MQDLNLETTYSNSVIVCKITASLYILTLNAYFIRKLRKEYFGKIIIPKSVFNYKLFSTYIVSMKTKTVLLATALLLKLFNYNVKFPFLSTNKIAPNKLSINQFHTWLRHQFYKAKKGEWKFLYWIIFHVWFIYLFELRIKNLFNGYLITI